MSVCSIELGDYQRYELIKFPGGELHVRVKQATMSEVEHADTIAITARIQNSEALIETILLCDAIKQDTERQVILILPYLPYGRADRRFSSGDCFGISTFARLIETTNVLPVTLDAHSASGSGHFKRIIDLPSNLFIKRAFDEFAECMNDGVTLLFPDKGARDRYHSVSSSYDNVLHCNKERNLLTGKLKGFSVPDKESFRTKKVLLVDDICDGGGTFLGIADGLKDYGLELALYVTHGIFSKGFDELSMRFEQIYTTDSFRRAKDFPTSKCTHLKIFETASFFVEQLSDHEKASVES